MNYRQIAYDRYDRNNFNLKLLNSYHHFINIQNISNRRPEYAPNPKAFFPPKLKINDHINNKYMFKREDKLYKKVLNNIKYSKVYPKMNDYYQKKEEQLKEFKDKKNKFMKKQMSKDNLIFKRRLKNQKSMIRIKEIDKDYDNHKKLVEMTRKIQDSKTFILPRISTLINRINSPQKNERGFTIECNSSSRRRISISKEAESLNLAKSHLYFIKLKNTE